jgi:hypothetical protein
LPEISRRDIQDAMLGYEVISAKRGDDPQPRWRGDG